MTRSEFNEKLFKKMEESINSELEPLLSHFKTKVDLDSDFYTLLTGTISAVTTGSIKSLVDCLIESNFLQVDP